MVELSVFGSTARDDADAGRDVDLLYVRGPNAARGLAFFGLRHELEALPGRRADLVPKEGLRWVIRDQVLGDAEVLHTA